MPVRCFQVFSLSRVQRIHLDADPSVLEESSATVIVVDRDFQAVALVARGECRNLDICFASCLLKDGRRAFLIPAEVLRVAFVDDGVGFSVDLEGADLVVELFDQAAFHEKHPQAQLVVDHRPCEFTDLRCCIGDEDMGRPQRGSTKQIDRRIDADEDAENRNPTSDAGFDDLVEFLQGHELVGA